MTWALYNFFIIISAILTAYERPQLRTMPRLARKIACEIKVKEGPTIQTQTRDLSETGLSLDLHEIYSINPEVSIILKGDGELTRLKGDMTRFDRRGMRRDPSVGIRFRDVTEAQHQSIVRQMYSSPQIWADAHSRTEAGALMSLGRIATSALRARTALQAMKRRSLRVDLIEQCRVRIDDETFEGSLQDVSIDGLAIELHGTIPESIGEVTVMLNGTPDRTIEIACRAVYSRGSIGGVKLGLHVLDRPALATWMSHRA